MSEALSFADELFLFFYWLYVLPKFATIQPSSLRAVRVGLGPLK